MIAPLPFEVSGRIQELPDTFTIEIRPCDGTEPAPFLPGQFNMLYPFGAGEVPISFSGPMAPGDRHTHTIRAVGQTTAALHRLQVGDRLGVRGPFGRGWPLERLAGKHLLIIAGGLGLVPLRPLVLWALEHRDELDGLQLFYGTRTPRSLLFPGQLRDWEQAFPLALSVDRAEPGWEGEIGVITSALGRAQFQPAATVALICGPEVMMRFCIRTLLRMRLPPGSIYLSMERNMQCAVGHCGHCQWGPNFVCRDGPVFRFGDIETWFYRREL